MHFCKWNVRKTHMKCIVVLRFPESVLGIFLKSKSFNKVPKYIK